MKRSYTNYLFALLFLSFTSLGFAQQGDVVRCYTMEADQALREQHPELGTLDDFEEWLAPRVMAYKESVQERAVTTVPIIFHIVHNGGSDNISATYINAQIEQLNYDFRRILGTSGYNTDSRGADTELEFCPAVVDPNGNPLAEPGINRISRSSQGWSTPPYTQSYIDNTIKPQSIWNPDNYVNVWVMSLSGGLLGYAQFPSQSGLGGLNTNGGSANTDGVVVLYSSVGSSTTPFPGGAPYDEGRTLTHELGHFFGLRHIWGDSNCGNDYCADTPQASGAASGCPNKTTCDGQRDMVENYMDYSYDACMNIFTGDQKARIQTVLANSPRRNTLGTSTACSGGGGGPTYDCPGQLANFGDPCDDGFANTINDVIQNDCSCAGTPPSCVTSPVDLVIVLDNYPGETTWTLRTSGGSTVTSGGPYSTVGGTVSQTFNLAADNYVFTINDSYGDGICCAYGSGSYSLTSGGTTIVSGGAFGASEVTNFCVEGGGGPTYDCPDEQANIGDPCNDGDPTTNNDVIQNDCTCAGTSIYDCPSQQANIGDSCNDGDPTTNNDVIQNDCTCAGTPTGGGGSTTVFGSYFETGWDGWSDGGSDCARYSGSRSWEGSYSIRLRDNSGTASAMTSSAVNLSSYSSVDLQFYFYAYSMENGEDFWVRYNDGSGWQTVATYARGTSFNNNTFYTATVTLSSAQYDMGSNARFRFQCDASSNNDQIYIDQVTLTGNSGGARVTSGQTITQLDMSNRSFETDEWEGMEADLLLLPNPVLDLLTVRASDPVLTVRIHAADGSLVRVIGSLDKNQTIDVSNLPSGLYFLTVETEEEVLTEKFVKQ